MPPPSKRTPAPDERKARPYREAMPMLPMEASFCTRWMRSRAFNGQALAHQCTLPSPPNAPSRIHECTFAAPPNAPPPLPCQCNSAARRKLRRLKAKPAMQYVTWRAGRWILLRGPANRARLTTRREAWQNRLWSSEKTTAVLHDFDHSLTDFRPQSYRLSPAVLHTSPPRTGSSGSLAEPPMVT